MKTKALFPFFVFFLGLMTISLSSFSQACTISNTGVSNIEKTDNPSGSCTINFTVFYNLEINSGEKFGAVYFYSAEPPAPGSDAPACPSTQGSLLGVLKIIVNGTTGTITSNGTGCLAPSTSISLITSGSSFNTGTLLTTVRVSITAPGLCSTYPNIGANLYNSQAQSADIGTKNWQCANTLLHSTPLPIMFSDFKAQFVNHQLKVSWQSIPDASVESFTIEGSNDGDKWTVLKTIDSQASSTLNASQNYSLSIDLSGLSLAGFIFSLFLIPVFKSRKIRYLLIFTAVLFLGSCLKERANTTDENNSMWVRIVQHNKDGSTEISKSIRVLDN